MQYVFIWVEWNFMVFWSFFFYLFQLRFSYFLFIHFTHSIFHFMCIVIITKRAILLGIFTVHNKLNGTFTDFNELISALRHELLTFLSCYVFFSASIASTLINYSCDCATANIHFRDSLFFFLHFILFSNMMPIFVVHQTQVVS